MSYSTMLGVPESGEVVHLEEFRNSHGSASRIWDSIQKKFMPGAPWVVHTPEQEKQFWGLVNSESLSQCERIAFAFTFDKAICERERAGDLARLLREFDAANPREPGYVNHLPAIAEALERHANGDYIGFAFIQTSVCGDAWDVPDVCRSEFHDSKNADANEHDGCEVCGNDFSDRNYSRPFDWSRDKGSGRHFMLFENYAELPTPA